MALLPVLEKAYLGEFAYIIYEPLEWIRHRNIFFWRTTEAGYEMCGGKVSPHKRVYFESSPRRGILWHRNGQIMAESFSKGKGEVELNSKYWNEQGIITQEIETYENGDCRKILFRNENGVIINSNEFERNGNGVMKWFDDVGEVVAMATCKNVLTPAEGSILLPPKQEGNKLVRYLLFYKDGKEVDRKVYSQRDLKQ